MRALVTGHDGYIGSVLVPVFEAAGHEVVGLDSFLFEGCDFGAPVPGPAALRTDVRDVDAAQLGGFDAIVHLAAVSNDPVGDLDPDTTYEINHRGSVRLAQLAKNAGVPRFLFSSSCSLYGAAGDAVLDEHAELNPVTPYGHSKILAERDISKEADDAFTPTFLRNATAYGVSPRLRSDLVVNNLVGYAWTTGEVLIKSDGTPWRPLVHIEDIARAFVAVLEAPRELVHNEAFNVGQSEENYRIRDVASIVEEVVPGTRIVYAEGGGPDVRSYQVDCAKLRRVLPQFQPRWSVRRGVQELADAFRTHGVTLSELSGPRYGRIQRVLELQQQGLLEPALRWRASTAASEASDG